MIDRGAAAGVRVGGGSKTASTPGQNPTCILSLPRKTGGINQVWNCLRPVCAHMAAVVVVEPRV